MDQRLRLPQYSRWILAFILTLTLARLVSAAFMPPLQDEAYYFRWASYLDFGYFDHPPLVAWLAAALQLWPANPLAARAGTLILSLASMPFLLGLFRVWGLSEGKTLFFALILALANLGGILLGYVTTPDIPLLFCWIAALHEAAVALKRDPRRWLSAGVFTGLGIMGKYTMALIGPILLLALLAEPRRLREKWPYLGALACVITLLPHLYWLSQNDWITLRFQFGRGLKSEYGVAMQLGTQLPLAQAPSREGPEAKMASYFVIPEKEIKKPKRKLTPLQRYWRNTSNYMSGQLSLWGFLLVPLAYGAWQRYRHGPKKGTAQGEKAECLWPNSSLKVLAWSSALVPLIAFGLISPFQQVEVNWPAMYLIGAAALLARWLPLTPPLMVGAALCNILCSLLITLHTITPLLRESPHNDRFLRETYGYAALSSYLSGLPEPVFTDTYQNLSQLNFYQPQLPLQQWPGIARSSELIRRPAMNPLSWESLRRSSRGFYLLTDNFVPPAMPDAELRGLSEILDCLGEGLRITPYDSEQPYMRQCQNRVHRWSLAYYRFADAKER